MHIALFCIVAERTKHIHAQGTLAKRLLGVGETTGHQIKGTSAFFLQKWLIFTRTIVGNACFRFGYG